MALSITTIKQAIEIKSLATHMTLKQLQGLINLMFGIIGMIIIWEATHSWFAMFGGFVAAIHLEFHSS